MTAALPSISGSCQHASPSWSSWAQETEAPPLPCLEVIFHTFNPSIWRHYRQKYSNLEYVYNGGLWKWVSSEHVTFTLTSCRRQSGSKLMIIIGHSTQATQG